MNCFHCALLLVITYHGNSNAFDSSSFQIIPYSSHDCIFFVQLNYGNNLLITDVFADFTNEKDTTRNLLGDVSRLFSYNKIKSQVLQIRTKNKDLYQGDVDGSGAGGLTYMVTAALRAETSMTSDTEASTSSSGGQDKVVDISSDAKKVLRNKQYIQFFQTCGPTYVRSMFHAQEVAAIFQFRAASDYDAQQFAEALRRYVYGNKRVFHSYAEGSNTEGEGGIGFIGSEMMIDYDDTVIMDSLSIDIVAYGLGLNQNGIEALVATNLQEYNDVIKYAFTTMITKTKRSSSDMHDMVSPKGLLYGIEVVPWVDNVAFLDMARLTSTKIRVDTPYGMIESSKMGRDSHGRNIALCSSLKMKADDFGKCCRSHEMVIVTAIEPTGLSDATPQQHKRCQPTTYVPTSAMRDNLAINAEFVALLSEVKNAKAKKLSTLGQCVNQLRALPSQFDYYFLYTSDNVIYDEHVDGKYTVKELKAALDPAGNLDIIKMLSDENDEFNEMFYQPCLSALYGIGMKHRQRGTTKRGTGPDPRYFMAQPWYNIEECVRPSCLEPNMAWDRVNGKGCVKGILGRDSSMSSIPSHNDEHCAKTATSTCKFGYTLHANLLMQMDNCRQALPRGKNGRGNSIELSMGYLMEHFCMPQVANDEDPAETSKMDQVDASLDICVSVKYHFLQFCVL